MTDETSVQKFDPRQYLIPMRTKKGNAYYLEIKYRVAWFRSDHPDGGIHTEMLQASPPIFKATIVNSDGITIATGHGSAIPTEKVVWEGKEIEKAETAALGRALSNAGYGSVFIFDSKRMGDESHAHSQAGWANARMVGELLESARDKLGIDRDKALAFAGIDRENNFAAWNDRFANRNEAGQAIKEAHAAEAAQRADETPPPPPEDKITPFPGKSESAFGRAIDADAAASNAVPAKTPTVPRTVQWHEELEDKSRLANMREIPF